MALKTAPAAPASIKGKAKKLLAFTREQVRLNKGAAELFLVVFGSQGKAMTIFTSPQEWADFQSTEECKEIHQIIDALKARSANGNGATNGRPVLSMELPKSVHAALTKEAAAEGVSLEQLCLSKLVAQLRELV